MTLQEPYSFLDTNLRKEAIWIEIDSIMSNGTLEVVGHPYEYKPIECKWMFKSLG
jgi:hypothetical protein